MKKIFLLIFFFSFGLLLTGCGKQPETCSITNNFSCWTTTWTLDLTWTIKAVIFAIKDMDFFPLSLFVWPNGVRFSAYEHVNTNTDVLLSTDEIENALSISRSYTRWTYDGKGDPIDLWIWQYREKFVYDADFINAPEVYHNQKFERGNIINNIFDVYSGKEIVEYHFPQIDPQYEGMDWRSLYLVFENIDGQWYLIGIIHWARTI
jgi:hypothetical protein